MKTAGIILVSLPLLLSLATSQLFAVQYPSIAVMFANTKVDESEPSPEELARYDMVIVQRLSKELLSKAKSLNPRLELLQTGQGPWMNITGYGDQILNAPGFEERFLLHTSGGKRITWWNDSIAIYNFALPEAVNWLVQYVKSQYDADAARQSYSGMYFDALHKEIYQWIKGNVEDPETGLPSTIDYDLSGNDDTQQELDTAWSAGVDAFLQALRTQYPGLHFVANDAPKYLDQYKGNLNGAFFENELRYWLDDEDTLWFDPWKDIVDLGNRWISESQKPALSIAGLGSDPEYVESPQFQNKYMPWEEPVLWNELLAFAYKDIQRMRFGLGISCLAGLAYIYDWGPTCWGKTYWWYPEYDANGRGRHYLGSPTGLPEKIFLDSGKLVYKRDFERGRVYVNATMNPLTVPLEREFYLLDGKKVNQVNIGPWDAVFLIIDPEWRGGAGIMPVSVLNMLLSE